MFASLDTRRHVAAAKGCARARADPVPISASAARAIETKWSQMASNLGAQEPSPKQPLLELYWFILTAANRKHKEP